MHSDEEIMLAERQETLWLQLSSTSSQASLVVHIKDLKIENAKSCPMKIGILETVIVIAITPRRPLMLLRPFYDALCLISN